MKNYVKGLLVIFLSCTLLVCLTACGGVKLDFQEFIDLSYSGLNTNGKAELNIDKKELGVYLRKMDISLMDSEYFASSVKTEIDTTEQLSNGDEIVVTVSFDEGLAKQFDLNIPTNELKYKVSGLTEGKRVDIFENVNILYEGVSSQATAKVQNNWKDEFLSKLEIDVYIMEGKDIYSSASDLNNGDSIVMTLSLSVLTTLEENGYIPEKESKRVKVNGLPEYIKDVKELSDKHKKEIQQITKDCLHKSLKEEEYFNAEEILFALETCYDWDKYSYSSVEYVESYCIIKKDDAKDNFISNVYSVNVSGESKRNEKNVKNKTGYVVVRLDEVAISDRQLLVEKEFDVFNDDEDEIDFEVTAFATLKEAQEFAQRYYAKGIPILKSENYNVEKID